MTPSMSMPASRPPARALLRTAGILTQLAGAGCLLLGTITFVLVQQNKTAGTGYTIAWAVAAMTALLFGGFMARGGLVSLLGSALLDLAFGITLIAVDHETVRGVFRVLPASDVEVLANGLTVAGIACCAIAALCGAAIPQALRYGRWLHESASCSAPPAQVREEFPSGATAKGWAAPPPPHTSIWRMPAAPPDEQRSRRRMYIALAGFAIGFGAGVGVLVSSTASPPEPPVAARRAPVQAAAATPDVGRAEGSAIAAEPPALDVDGLLAAQREMLENGDLAGLAAMMAPVGFGFGVDADAIGEGPKAIEAQLVRDLGDLVTGDVAVTVKTSHVGTEGPHAWIAQELEIGTRRFAVLQLAAFVDGKWRIAAWHWAVLVPDAVAEEKKILGTLPSPAAVANAAIGDATLAAAARAAFASRAAVADARSERADAFNFGSGPGERSIGGRGIKRVFGKLRAQMRVHDGVRAVTADAWEAAPGVGYAALNVDFATKTRALTDLTHTFRVLAVFVKEGGAWKVVATQWSHGGPIR